MKTAMIGALCSLVMLASGEGIAADTEKSIQERIRDSTRIVIGSINHFQRVDRRPGSTAYHAVSPEKFVARDNGQEWLAECDEIERLLGPSTTMSGKFRLYFLVPPDEVGSGSELLGLRAGHTYIFFLGEAGTPVIPVRVIGVIEVANEYELVDEDSGPPENAIRPQRSSRYVTMSHDALLKKIRSYISYWNMKSGEIYLALLRGNVDKVQHLLSEDHHLIHSRRDGLTLLHLAADRNLQIVKLLVANGAVLDARELGWKRTPLLMTINPLVVNYLLESGADVHAVDPETGLTALHMASFGGENELIRLLLEEGLDINAQYKHAGSPLHCAALRNQQDSVELLIKSGANVASRASSGRTPLHEASYFADRGIAEFLILSGADVHATDNEGLTPLHKAARRPKDGPLMMKFLLEAGAEVNGRSISGVTPLQIAIELCRGHNVEFLLANGADMDALEDVGLMALRFAARWNGWDVVKLFLRQKPDVLLKTLSGYSALHFAAMGGENEVVKELLSLGEDVNARAKQFLAYPQILPEDTPLHLASARGRTSTVRLLLKAGAFVNAKNEESKTPLDNAERRRHED